MMTIEELHQLNQWTEEVYDHGTPNMPNADWAADWFEAVTDLIDDQISRQRVSDAEIDEAENFVKAVASRRVEIDEELMKIFGESNRHWNLIVDALCAYRKPDPCEWCRDKRSDDFECSTYSEFEDGDDGFWETMGAIARCPKCGRELEVSDEHSKTNKATD